ncbi:MAG: MBL fold metallo-hydrolase [bacterium]
MVKRGGTPKVEEREARLIFLGTGGGRLTSFRQTRASGGLWLEAGETRIHVDPGPEALTRVLKRNLDPTKLSAIVLTHRHLDHCADINVMIEAMSEGGNHPNGALYVPSDALEGYDPVVYHYLRRFVPHIATLDENSHIAIGPFSIRTLARYPHGIGPAKVDTFRLMYECKTPGMAQPTRIAHFVDGKHAKGAEAANGCDIAIIHCLLPQSRPEIDHLSPDETREIIRIARPKKVIITHFGMAMLAPVKPSEGGASKGSTIVALEIADRLSQEAGVEVIPAWDNLRIDLTTSAIARRRPTGGD